MIDNIIKKYNLNVNSMIKNGTVAVVAMFAIGAMFGVENIMIAFPIALTSTVLGRQNFYVKTISKVLNIIVIDLTIVLTAYIASLNIWLGIIINIIAIFLIVYLVTSPYEPTFFKPFIMLYIFTQYSTITLIQLPSRLLAVVFGIIIVAILSIIKKGNEKKALESIIENALKNLNIQVSNIMNNNYDNTLMEKCTKEMMDLAYRIYITRHKKYLTTNLGNIQFNIFLYIEELNLYLKVIDEKYKEGKITKDNLEKIEKAIFKLRKNTKEEVIKENSILYNYELKKIENLICRISENIEALSNIDFRTQNKVYVNWQRSELDMPIVLFKEHFNIQSIRFKFAMRMSISLTIALLIGDILGMYKIIWAIITIMSIMQSYYEDTILKAKDRVIGNMAAVIFTGIFINIINNETITIILLIISLYLLYGFKEYYKISFFAAIASICIASLTERINVLLAYRIMYVIVGVVAVLIVNRYLFPYKIANGINDLKKKILKLDLIVMDKIKKNIESKADNNDIRDYILHITLLTQKLYLRNLQCNDIEIQAFIEKNNAFIINLGYMATTDLIDG